jgi:hypothetical protein
MGIKDLIDPVSSKMGDMWEAARAKGADAFENVAGRLRGAPVTPGGTAAPAAPAPSAAPMATGETMYGTPDGGVARNLGDAEAAMRYNQGARATPGQGGVRVPAPNPTNWSATQGLPQGVQSPTADILAQRYQADVAAHERSIRMGGANPSLGVNPPDVNPNVGKGRPSAEAQAFRASQGGATPPGGTPPEAPAAAAEPAKPGGVRGLLSKAGTGLYRLGQGAGLVQAGYGAKNVVDGDYGNAADNIFQGAATAVNPGVGFVGNVLTGLRDAGMKAIIDRTYGTNKTFLPQTQGGSAAATTPDVKPEKDDGEDTLVDTTRTKDNPNGLRVSPDDLINGRVIGKRAEVIDPDTGKPIPVGPDVGLDERKYDVPVPGQGAFQRTTPGDRGIAQKLGARTPDVKPGEGEDESKKGLRLPQANTLAQHMVNLAALNANAHAAQAREQGALAQANVGIKAAQAGVQIKKANQEIEKGANDALDKDADAHIAGLMKDKQYGIEPQKTLETDAAYKNRIELQKKQTLNRINATLANSREKLADASDTKKQQLFLLDRFARKVEGGRSDLLQTMRDLFGNKRFDSNDLYSYAPAAKEIALLPGGGAYKIVTRNGNTLTATRAQGGEWNVLSPNGPVDADIAELIGKQIEAQAQAKKGSK